MTKQQYKADLRYFLDQITELKKQPIEETTGFDSNGNLLNIGDMVNILSIPGLVFTVTGFGDGIIETDSLNSPHYIDYITKYVCKQHDINGVELRVGDKFNYKGETKIIKEFVLIYHHIYIKPTVGLGIYSSTVEKHVDFCMDHDRVELHLGDKFLYDHQGPFTITGFIGTDKVKCKSGIDHVFLSRLCKKYVEPVKYLDKNGTEVKIGDKVGIYPGKFKTIRNLYENSPDYFRCTDGVQWNLSLSIKDTKYVEPVKLGRWKPEMDEFYYYIDCFAKVQTDCWSAFHNEKMLYDMGNVYRTYYDAEQALNEHLLLVKMQDFADQDTGEDNMNFQVYYNLDKKMFQSSSFIYPMLPIVFKTLGQSKLIEKEFGTDLDIFK